MTTTTVRLPGTVGDPASTSLVLIEPGRKRRRLVLPWIPDEIEAGNAARNYEQQPRPGRDPLLLDLGGNLPTLNLTVRLVGPAMRASVLPLINELNDIASEGRVVIAMLSERPLGRCKLTGLTVRETEWERPGTPVDAEAELELTRANTGPSPIGPVSALKRRPRGSAKNMARRR